MRIVSWNVNGIRSIHQKNALVPFLETIKPDIVCIQETKAEQEQSPLDLPEYDEQWNAAEKKGYSGTAIFSKMKPLSVVRDFPAELATHHGIRADQFGNPNKEGRIIAAEYEKFFVVNVYTPNAKPDLSRLTLRYKHWDPAFLAYCKRLETKKPVIFCGDLNVAHTADDLANPEENDGEHGFTREEREGIDNITAAGFVDTFRLFTKGKGRYTWWSHFSNSRARNIGWRIDYIFVSASLAPHVTQSKIFPDVFGSDHCPVMVEL